MKKPYISPTSEKIQMETGHMLLSGSGYYTDKDVHEKLDGDTDTDEQW